MYEPTATRPKKTAICRSRTGCTRCRQRRKKCDEQKPSCGSCLQIGMRCEQFMPAFEFRSVEIRPAKNAMRRQVTSSSRRTATTISSRSPCSLGSLGPGSPKGTCKPPSTADWDDTDLLPWHLDFESDNDFGTPPSEWAFSDPPLRGTQLDLESAVVVPNHDYGHAISFYLNIWRDQCLPALHLSFHHIEAICGPSRLITDTMATLSACRLSRTLPQRKLYAASSASGLCFRPDAGHECLSGELYSSAMRQMRWWSHKELDSHPTVALAVLVLFCYLESSMGNFKEFQVHSQAVEKLLTSYSHHVMSTGAGLLAAWVEVKMQNWWRRAHFSVPDFYRDWRVPLLDPIFETMFTTTAYRRASVLWILCESHRLSTAAIVECCEKRCNIQMTTSNEASLFVSTATEHESSQNELTILLSTQSARLDEWHASLWEHELPEVTEDANFWNSRNALKPEDAVIRFKSHELAINYAYYVTARIMQCTRPLQSLDSHSLADVDDPCEDIEIWIQILLRIAAGISWKDCVRLNVYIVSFAGLLLACALRSRELATGLWIQGWLEERVKENGFEEGNFPVYQILDALQVVNCERRKGRDMISLFQTVDDQGGSGKFGSYSSQRIQSFLVYARCQDTGSWYSSRVSPQDLTSKIEPHHSQGSCPSE